MSKIAITVLVVAHLGVAILHGRAHSALAVTLSGFQNAFVLLVIVIAPIVAGALAWTRHVRIGVWIFVLSMTGALVFGVYYHYILVSPDNVAHLPGDGLGAHSTFIGTAGALAVLELVSAVYGAFCLGRLRGTPADEGGRG